VHHRRRNTRMLLQRARKRRAKAQAGGRCTSQRVANIQRVPKNQQARRASRGMQRVHPRISRAERRAAGLKKRGAGPSPNLSQRDRPPRARAELRKSQRPTAQEASTKTCKMRQHTAGAEAVNLQARRETLVDSGVATTL